MAYDDLPLWTWCAQEIKFTRSDEAQGVQFGKAVISTMTPHWLFSLLTPPLNYQRMSEAEAMLFRLARNGPVRVADPRCPVPQYYADLDRRYPAIERTAFVPELRVKATSTLNDGEITVDGVAGDVITYGDPIAFTHDGVRHYYKAAATQTLTGGEDVLPVYLPPRASLTGLDIVCDRISPTQAFSVDFRNMSDPTTLDRLTPLRIAGVEYTGGF